MLKYEGVASSETQILPVGPCTQYDLFLRCDKSFITYWKWYAATKPEMKHLHALESYQHCIRSFNNNRISDSINYISRTESEIEQSAPLEINMRLFVLNIQSLMYKMENDSDNLSNSLKKLFLLDSSYNGFENLNFKHFQNYFLSLLYGKRELAFGLMDYVV